MTLWWRKPSKKIGVMIHMYTQNSQKNLGFTGSIILFIGTLTPIMSMPIMGGLSYIQYGENGVVVMILAIISFVCVLMDEYKALWITGVLSACIILIDFFEIYTAISDFKNKIGVNATDGILIDFAKMAMQSVQLQWGWALLFIGVVLIITSAAIKDKSI